MAVEHAQARERRAVPHLDGVVPQPERERDQFEYDLRGHLQPQIEVNYSPRDDLGVVVLEAVDALGVLRAAVDALQVVLAAPPIVLYSFNVPDDGGVKFSVECMFRMGVAAWPRLEEEPDPSTALGQTAPQAVGVDLKQVQQWT